MKLLQTLVSKANMGELEHNDTRFEGLKHLLRVAADQKANLVLLPAGYFTAAEESDVQSIFADVTRLAKRSGLVVALGVDLVEGAKGKGKKQTELVLPY